MTTDTDTLVARLTEDELTALCHRLCPDGAHGPVCRFCGRDPYHYVDIGVGMQRAAVECCDLGIAMYQHGDEQLIDLAALMLTAGRALIDLRAQRDEARAGEDELLATMREIAEISERKESRYPPDWRDQIAACPECHRYKGHPIQNGICDQHRKPIYAQEDHDRHETKILGYRAKDIARAALASHDKRKEGRV